MICICNILLVLWGMFSIWLLEQQDREDSVGQFARLAWQDYNSGCAAMYKDAVGWKKHFDTCHGAKLDKLMELLGDAYVEYAQQLTTQTPSI